MRIPGSQGRRSRVKRKGRNIHRSGSTTGVAGSTIQIDGEGWHIGRMGRILMMFVLVMSEMLCSSAGFVLAIGRCRCPGELERQENKQEDGKPAAHRGGL